MFEYDECDKGDFTPEQRIELLKRQKAYLVKENAMLSQENRMLKAENKSLKYSEKFLKDFIATNFFCRVGRLLTTICTRPNPRSVVLK